MAKRKLQAYKPRNAPVRRSQDPKKYQAWYYENVTKPKRRRSR